MAISLRARTPRTYLSTCNISLISLTYILYPYSLLVPILVISIKRVKGYRALVGILRFQNSLNMSVNQSDHVTFLTFLDTDTDVTRRDDRNEPLFNKNCHTIDI